MSPAFDTLYAHGMARVALASPVVALAEPATNAERIEALWRRAHDDRACLLLTPEMSICGYTLDDLVLQTTLLDAVEAALKRLLDMSADLFPALVVGAPLRSGDAVFNCALVIHRGRILGVVPKSWLPNYREFYEKRWFAPASRRQAETIRVAGQDAPFGEHLVFEAEDLPGFVLGVEICEDLWAPVPPSTALALAGATVLANPSASNITIGKAAERQALCDAQSRRLCAAYLYAASGQGESTTDLAWDGHLSVVEMGEPLADGPRFDNDAGYVAADLDLERLVAERRRFGTFRDGADAIAATVGRIRRVGFRLNPPLAHALPLSRAVARFPFVPDDPARLDQDCFEAYNIPVQGLVQRLRASGVGKAVIGVSGGLDSTQALLVAARAFDRLGRSREDIIGVSLPGFATGEATRANAAALMDGLGVTRREIDIRPAAERMLRDLGHPYAEGQAVHDVTFENVQAGLRTDYLFRLANHEGGLVIGTGDLSELALGWCTYGVGDHMSHYGVNSGVAKTLIQHLIRWCVQTGQHDAGVSETLLKILATEISPELVPPGADGAIQSTEAVIGPYALQDFTLHYVLRYGFGPAKIAFLAHAAWGDVSRGGWPAHIADADKRAYDLPEIVRWLEVFARRFYQTSQFKRSALPNGPKVSSAGALSPRGDWRAPSDASARIWLEAIARLKRDARLS